MQLTSLIFASVLALKECVNTRKLAPGACGSALRLTQSVQPLLDLIINYIPYPAPASHDTLPSDVEQCGFIFKVSADRSKRDQQSRSMLRSATTSDLGRSSLRVYTAAHLPLHHRLQSTMQMALICSMRRSSCLRHSATSSKRAPRFAKAKLRFSPALEAQ